MVFGPGEILLLFHSNDRMDLGGMEMPFSRLLSGTYSIICSDS